MPTINQLPTATAVNNSDVLPLSQNGLTRSVTVGTLLGGTQPALSASQDFLWGRYSPSAGAPEALRISTGLTTSGATLVANGQDHTGFLQTASLAASDEIIINNGAVPKRALASSVRGLFAAGSGVSIDQNGVISVTGGTSGSGAPGPKGDTGAAGQGFSFRGAFQANTSYAPYDVVVNGGQTYVSTTSFVAGNTFDQTKWTLIAAQGAAGAAGAQGPTGLQGPAGPNVPATPSAIGVVKPGAGLSISSDGTLSIGSVSLSTIAQGGASTGQVLGWTGTGWGPTSSSATGVAAFNSRIGSVTLNLGDITTVVGTGASARSNLGLASIASSGSYSDLTGAPTVPAAATTMPLANGVAAPGMAVGYARADHVHPVDPTRLAAAGNLSDLANPTAARANLGLGAAATLAVGTSSGTVAAGNDARIVSALQPGAIPAASGQLLGGSGTAGSALPISLGAGLAISGGTLSATSGGSYSLAPASTTTLGGIKPDGVTVTTANDGTLTVAAVGTSALPDIATIGGPSLSDIDNLSRAGADYKVTLSARAALFRKTPAGSRTIALAAGSTTATLSAGDHDRTIVVTGIVSGSLAVDGSIIDGFRCQVINHTGAALVYSGIVGLQGTTSLPNAASCWITLSNASVEATAPVAATAVTPGGSSGQIQVNSGGAFGGVSIGSGLTLSQGTLSAAAASYTLPAATTSALGGIKPDGSTLTASADGTLTVSGASVLSLTDIGTLGGPSLSDVDILNRGGNDFKTTLSATSSLFRKTPAGSRTITLASGAATAMLTAADHDKTVVIAGSVAGSIATDGTITDGFRCQVINHTGSALSYSGIMGLAGTTSLPNNASCWISLSNSTLEATASSASTGVSTFNARQGAVSLTLADVTAVTGTGSSAQASLGLGGASLLNIGTGAGSVAAGNDARIAGALQTSAIPAATGQLLAGSGVAGAANAVSVGTGLSLSGSTLTATYTYALPAATSSALGGVKQGTGVTIAADGTISASGSSGVSTFNGRSGGVTLGLSDVTAVTGTGGTAQSNLGLGNASLLSVGTTAGTVAAGNDSRIVSALQSAAIPAAAGQLLGGSGTVGAASAVGLGAGLALSGGILSASTSYTLPAATSTTLGGVKQGGGVAIAADGTLSVPAYMTAGVAGVVGSLPGGPGATVFRYVFVRPCTFAANLAAPYPPQAQAVTAPSANASFGLAKRTSGGSLTSFGTLTIAPSGAVSATTTATAFGAGDELVVTAPNPADASLADVSLTFTGIWG